MTKAALSWDDAGNNRAFLSNTISSTSNGASIYLLAKAKAETYLSETGKPLKDDIFHAPLPKGPAGQFSYHVPFSNIVPAYTKNQKAAMDFLRWFQSKDIYEQWFTSQQGFSVGATKMWQDDPLWKVDPVMAPFRTAAHSGRFAGYAGPAGRAAAEVISKFIIVDMYTKAVQGMAPEDAGQMGAWRAGKDLRPPHAAAQSSAFSLVTALPGLVSTGRSSAADTADAAREVEKWASSTASHRQSAARPRQRGDCARSPSPAFNAAIAPGTQ